MRELRERLRAHWRTKLWLGAALAVLFCAGYFGLQRVHVGEPRSLEPSIVDRWVSFETRWTIVYQSMYLMLPLAWLATTRQQLRRYAIGFAVLSAVGFLCFFLFPTIGPRPAHVREGLLGLIHAVDSPLNAFPSLHMALAAYTMCFIAHVLGRRTWVLIILVAWTTLIGYATLATKQHYFVDVPAGLALGSFGHVMAGWLQTVSMRPASLAPAERGAA